MSRPFQSSRLRKPKSPSRYAEASPAARARTANEFAFILEGIIQGPLTCPTAPVRCVLSMVPMLGQIIDAFTEIRTKHDEKRADSLEYLSLSID